MISSRKILLSLMSTVFCLKHDQLSCNEVKKMHGGTLVDSTTSCCSGSVHVAEVKNAYRESRLQRYEKLREDHYILRAWKSKFRDTSNSTSVFPFLLNTQKLLFDKEQHVVFTDWWFHEHDGTFFEVQAFNPESFDNVFYLRVRADNINATANKMHA